MNNSPREAAPWADLSREFAPIPRVDLTDEIITRIKMLITRGKLMPGSRLPPERELARLLSVGRPALRQALKALATMAVPRLSRRLPSERAVDFPYVISMPSVSPW